MIDSIIKKMNISKKSELLLKLTQSKFGIGCYNSNFSKLLFKYLNTIALMFFVWTIGS